MNRVCVAMVAYPCARKLAACISGVEHGRTFAVNGGAFSRARRMVASPSPVAAGLDRWPPGDVTVTVHISTAALLTALPSAIPTTAN